MKSFVRPEFRIFICLILSAVFLSSCSAFHSLLGEVKIRKPQVEFAAGRLSKLSFDGVDFLFDLKIRNPNSLGLKLAGFDYDFLINGASFIKGKQEKELAIEAQGESTVQFPLSLSFVDLYRTFQSLRDQDISTYRLNCGFAFDVPVLGVVNVPVSKEGEFPLLKLPKVNLGALKLDNLTLSGADLQLSIKLSNPNAFSMILDRFHYQLEINRQNWVSGDTGDKIQIEEKGESLIEIPISLDLFQMGRSVYQALTGDESLNYQFGGEFDLTTSVPLLGQVSLPFNRSGRIKLVK